ncbi:MAG: hypothetical protein A2020_10530 [Lentisphaerae bacterium GWF2_45_14]|nr:MAG: hypothetical protein A2020_10530 [Lentisphaerae bacterium GWF2_45_14]
MNRAVFLIGIMSVLFFCGIPMYGKDCRVGVLFLELPESYPKPLVTRYDTSAKLVVGSTLRENESQSFISIMETYINKYPVESRERLLKLYPEKELGPFLAKKKSMYDDFQTLDVSTQKINKLEFVKLLWCGNQKVTGAKMRGIYLVVRDGDTILELNYVDYDDYFDLCSEEAMKIFRTLSR